MKMVRFETVDGHVAYVKPENVTAIVESVFEEGVTLIRAGSHDLIDVVRVKMHPDAVMSRLRTPAPSSSSE